MDRVTPADYVPVPSGEFIFGSCESDEDSEIEERPQYKLNIPSFRIKRTVVTVGEWRAFLEDSGYEWNEREAIKVTSPTDNHPIVCVNWFDANAYCEWGGKILARSMRLPNEFEWEKACRGTNGQRYPVEINGAYDENIYNWIKRIENGTETGDFLNPVSARDVTRQTPFGCLDMWECVSEWCDNWYDDELGETIAKYGGNIALLLANAAGKEKSLRGGLYFDGHPRCAKRGGTFPSLRHDRVGFRPVLEQ